MNDFKLKRYQKGFSLIELLVGMTLSLLVAAAALTYMVSSSRSLTEKTGLDLIQENTRFALEILTSNIRLAGLTQAKNSGSVSLNGDQTDNESNVFEPLFTDVSICAPNFNNQIQGADNSPCNVDNQNNVFGGIAMPSDRIAIQRETVGSLQTCAGNVIAQSEGVQSKLVNVFWAGDLEADGVSSLYCQTYISQAIAGTGYSTFTPDANPIPLVDGIEMLQVQYGVDTSADGDGDVDTYQSFAYILANPDSSGKVLSVKIGLLVSPGQAIASEQNSDDINDVKTYRVLDGFFQSAANDRVRRQATSVTIFLPNMAS